MTHRINNNNNNTEFPLLSESCWREVTYQCKLPACYDMLKIYIIYSLDKTLLPKAVYTKAIPGACLKIRPLVRFWWSAPDSKDFSESCGCPLVVLHVAPCVFKMSPKAGECSSLRGLWLCNLLSHLVFHVLMKYYYTQQPLHKREEWVTLPLTSIRLFLKEKLEGKAALNIWP